MSQDTTTQTHPAVEGLIEQGHLSPAARDMNAMKVLHQLLETIPSNQFEVQFDDGRLLVGSIAYQPNDPEYSVLEHYGFISMMRICVVAVSADFPPSPVFTDLGWAKKIVFITPLGV